MLERFKVPESDRVYVGSEEMRAATETVFQAVGVEPENASLAAQVLVTNDLRGVESHGVSNMLRSYVAQYQAGTLNPRPEFTIVRETETTAVIDGGMGLGVHVAPRAMDVAIEKAARYGMGSAVAYNVGHMGGAGFHAMRALPHDMIGIAMSSGGSLATLPTWGAKPRFGTNPIAWAIPAGSMPPFVLDMATSSIANNKIRLARRVGAQVEPAWIAQMDGTPILERVDVPEEFYMLPLGGTREQGSHKGYGLMCVVESLANILSGAGPSFLTRKTAFHFQAMRLDAYAEPKQFKADMDEFLRGLTETPPAPGHERVVYPGLLEAEETRQRLEEGIPYHVEVINWFRSIGSELGLRFAFL
jgi:L-2-hydroxycarboxylate dehydrogenase (NAD+)